MEIRKKITILFVIIVAFIIIFSSSAIYIIFSELRKEEFYGRLSSKAKLIAQMLIDIDEIDTELLMKIEQNNPLSLPNEKIYIYNFENKLIYCSDRDSSFNYSVKGINSVRKRHEVELKRDDFEVVGHFYSGLSDRIVVFVAATDIFGIKKLKRLRTILIVVFIVSLLVVFTMGRFFANRSLNQITALISEVDTIEASNLKVRLNEGNGKDEISRLAQTFNRFIERLELSFNMQKNFIANASHELRTPLTAISGQLEVILFKDRDAEEYRNTIFETYEDIKNLTDISNRLLLLAQASSDFDSINFIPCRIDDLIWQSRQELLNRNKKYYVEVSFSDKIDTEYMLLIQGNGLLLKTAFLNLMDNACKYSKPNAVHVLLSTDANHLIIQFKDRGIGISSEEIPNIFQPFYRSKQVITIKGHGIGLALVDKIIKLHRGVIKVYSKLEEGTIFELEFPYSVE